MALVWKRTQQPAQTAIIRSAVIVRNKNKEDSFCVCAGLQISPTPRGDHRYQSILYLGVAIPTAMLWWSFSFPRLAFISFSDPLTSMYPSFRLH
ncbi:hypothetical protein EJ08DRAFT_185749 [Tothia fuscella]|uniref:Uncharacterized protein n=1 Tax=Tothia fuscella TaxID=1048955 RepID=A0A9P4TYF8_9PEZI|nr:hypothetical protein EJ08DRAFT_185749 [Tothia fuscella]